MKKILLSLVLTVIALPGHAVMIGDKDWRQPVETAGSGLFSYDNLTSNNVCDAVTGACDGVYDGVDFTGWTWATNIEVAGLFDDLNVGPDNHFDTNSSYAETDSTWADEIIHIATEPGDTGLFLDTFATNIGPDYTGFLYGITRSDISDPNSAYLAHILDNPIGLDTAGIVSIPTDHTDGTFGVWLYKSAPVPEPATLLLFGVGLAGIGFVRRRKTSKD